MAKLTGTEALAVLESGGVFESIDDYLLALKQRRLRNAVPPANAREFFDRLGGEPNASGEAK